MKNICDYEKYLMIYQSVFDTVTASGLHTLLLFLTSSINAMANPWPNPHSQHFHTLAVCMVQPPLTLKRVCERVEEQAKAQARRIRSQGIV